MEFLKIIVLSIVSLGFLFLMTKFMGNKQVSQLSMFDYVTGITIGSIAAEMTTETTENPLNFLLAITVYAILAIVISVFTEKSIKARKLIVGRPIVLMDKGIIFRANLAKARIDLSDFQMMCRTQGCFDISQIETAILEFNGNMSLLWKSNQRPIMPSDMNISPKQEQIITSVIMDGKIMQKNLELVKHNEKWLNKQLKAQGIKRAEDVYFATCDSENNLVTYPMNKNKIEIDWFE